MFPSRDRETLLFPQSSVYDNRTIEIQLRSRRNCEDCTEVHMTERELQTVEGERDTQPRYHFQ